LIFGCKSRGEAAVAAKNVFHPLCYVREDEEIESEDQIEREAAVTCVINFGQCPHQAIAGPHPPIGRKFARPHIMADPTLLIHQPLNAAAVPRYVSGVRLREGAIEFVWGRAVFVSGGEVALEPTRARTQKVTLFEGAWISSASAIGTARPPTARGSPSGSAREASPCGCCGTRTAKSTEHARSADFQQAVQ
jgi:hypothetical protein